MAQVNFPTTSNFRRMRFSGGKQSRRLIMHHQRHNACTSGHRDRLNEIAVLEWELSWGCWTSLLCSCSPCRERFLQQCCERQSGNPKFLDELSIKPSQFKEPSQMFGILRMRPLPDCFYFYRVCSYCCGTDNVTHVLQGLLRKITFRSFDK
jgi:hypothetical protein